MRAHPSIEINLEFIVQGVLGTGLASFRLDVQVDEEKGRKEGSQEHRKVCSKLNLQRQSGGRKGINHRIHGKRRGRKGGHGQRRSGSLHEGGLGHCLRDNCWGVKEGKVSENYHHYNNHGSKKGKASFPNCY